MPQTYTRQEFYDLVWSKPMTHLAKDYGLSDVALHKLCQKYDIPKPPVGWWAKKAAGKPVKQTPLPPADEGEGGTIRISGGDHPQDPEWLKVVRATAKTLTSRADTQGDTPSHPVVARTAAKLRAKKSTATSALVAAKGSGIIETMISAGSVDRFETVVNQIVAAAGALGIKCAPTEKGAAFISQGETISFLVSEQMAREKHEFTEKEKAQEEAWQRKRDRQIMLGAQRRWNNSFDSYYPPEFPEWDYHPSGQFSFELEHRYFWGGTNSPRRSFRDAKVQRLDAIVTDIAVGIAVYAAAIKADQDRRDEFDRKLREQQQRREDAHRARYIDERRGAALDLILKEMDALQRLRVLVTRLRSDIAANESRVAQFLVLAEQILRARETALSADGRARRFEEERLFSDDDDHDFARSRFR